MRVDSLDFSLIVFYFNNKLSKELLKIRYKICRIFFVMWDKRVTYDPYELAQMGSSFLGTG